MIDDPGYLPPDTERDVMPVIARGHRSVPIWAFGLLAVAIAVLLFASLDARRRAMQAPAVSVGARDELVVPTAPALVIPPETELRPAIPVVEAPAQAEVPLPRPAAHPPQPVPAPPQSRYMPPSLSSSTVPDQTRAIAAGGSAVVVDAGTQPRNGAGQSAPNPASAGTPASNARVHAGMLQDRSTTVVQGTLIHAVLETGFDSTRPGFARAVVSRDIRGFDGTRVLIPRGSRLIGDYQADARAGQKRALIIWSRLIRPDGATIEIGSPVSDPVGRGGIKAEVNSHFLERFSGAILQSALDVGVNLASRSASRSIIVALPSNGGVASQIVQPANVVPTLTVKPATSISIFVARDLDFTEVENLP